MLTKITTTISKELIRYAVWAILRTGILKEGDEDYIYYDNYLKTGNRMFSDASLCKDMVECYKILSKYKTVIPINLVHIFSDSANMKLQVVLGKNHGFTEDDYNYVDTHCLGKKITDKIRYLISEVIRLSFRGAELSTKVSSCGSKYMIARYLILSELKGIKQVKDPFSRTASLLLKAKEQFPHADLYYNDISSEYFKYIKTLSQSPFKLVNAITDLFNQYFGNFDLKKEIADMSAEKSSDDNESEFSQAYNKFRKSISTNINNKDDIIASAAFFWNTRLSLRGRIQKKQFDITRICVDLDSIEKSLILSSALLHDVHMSNQDCQEFLVIDDGDTLIFLDTPYLHEDGSPDTTYDKPFTLDDMKNTLEKTEGSKAKYIFFHYENTLVESMLRKYGFIYRFSYMFPTETKRTVVYTKNIDPNIQLFKEDVKMISADGDRKAANP